MIQCARCGGANQPTSKYCLSCGAPLPAAAVPGSGAGGATPGGAAPGPAAPAPQPAGGGYAPPPAWGAPGFGPPPAQPGFPPPGAAPGHAGFGPAPGQGASPTEDERFRIGSPDGLNPFGATITPGHHSDFGVPAGSPPQQGYGPPQQGYGPPQQQAYGPPQQGYGPPQQGYGPPQAPPGGPAFGTPSGAHAPNQGPSPGFGPNAGAQPSPYGGHAPGGGFGPPEPYPPPAPHDDPGRPAQAGYPGQRPASAPPQAAPIARSAQTAAPIGRDPEQVEPGAARALAGFLVSYEQNENGVFWPLYQGQNVVGRKGAAPGLDIEIDHPTTSSRHALLYASARPARLKIEDSGSTNGTYLGEQPLERGRKHELRDGEIVRFGGFSAIVKLI